MNHPSKEVIKFEVNGRAVEVAVRPYDVLLDVLRNELDLIGTKRGCDQGSCGCCAVHIEGRPVLACLTLAKWAAGKKVTTIEGLANPEPHPLQTAFETCGATQCGFCTPGFIMSAKALLDRNAEPDEATIKEHISGNVCRCTGYIQIVEAVQKASEELLEKDRPHDASVVERDREAHPAGR
jgi:aerobic carbon-monoxide dehydrogenase small subunit